MQRDDGSREGAGSARVRGGVWCLVAVLATGWAPRVLPAQAPRAAGVVPGIEVLLSDSLHLIRGKRVGLLTNHSGRDRAGTSTIDRLYRAPGVKLTALFGPEHGLRGVAKAGEKVATTTDSATGVPVYSLYGDVQVPTPEMLKDVDVLVYDIQDVGARVYTFEWTLALAAAAVKRPVIVLDRPDPIRADRVEGNLLDRRFASLVGQYPVALRYGLTPGELLRYLVGTGELSAEVTVIPMKGYRRSMWYDETGIPWVNPSPNLRSLTQAILYPGVGMIESANVSVGRGTATPFEIIGAPWIAGDRLARYLSGRHLPGVGFEPVTFTPGASPYAHQRCGGVRLKVTDRAALDVASLGVELAAALYRLYPGKFLIDKTVGMIGSRQVLQSIKNGDDPRVIERRWQPGLEAFGRLRARYLLY